MKYLSVIVALCVIGGLPLSGVMNQEPNGLTRPHAEQSVGPEWQAERGEQGEGYDYQYSLNAE